MFDGILRIEDGLRRNQRQIARALLAALIGLLAISIALPAGGRFGAFAQTASPSPTETEASPSPTSTLPAGPQIRWLNPEDGTSTVISSKQDVDGLYHLVAWVFEVPDQPAVRFEAQNGDTIPIGDATRVGDSDTWESHWDLSGLSDGDYELHAILFQAGNEIDRHVIDVEINDADNGLPVLPDPDDQAEKAAIVHPANGAGLGYFTNASGVSRFVVDGVVSADATSVELLYTASVPGTGEPDWTSCATVSPESDPPPGVTPTHEDSQYVRIVCSVDSEDDPASISAVALVPYGSPDDLPDPFGFFTGAADGHRVVAYAQVPTELQLPGPQQVNPGEGGAWGCSENITATLLDQLGRIITGAKLDVHAAGPTDLLRFATDTPAASGRSPNQAPQAGGHTNQSGWHCGNQETSGNQGSHGRFGESDIKHTQTAPAGTNRNGRFVFALRTDAPGPTQFTVWADTDNDDLFCAEETHGNGSIGWGEGPPAPTGLPADVEGPCPGPTATTSPTPTPGPIVESGPCEGHAQNSETDRPGGGKVIVGTPGDDILEGTGGPDIICGLGGDDFIHGRGGNDQLYGGGGNDRIVGGGGHDLIVGGRGNDVLRGGRGRDVLRGGRGHDELFGGRGNDELYGGRGRDLLNGGPGRDLCRGGPGRDRLRNCER